MWLWKISRFQQNLVEICRKNKMWWNMLRTLVTSQFMCRPNPNLTMNPLVLLLAYRSLTTRKNMGAKSLNHVRTFAPEKWNKFSIEYWIQEFIDKVTNCVHYSWYVQEQHQLSNYRILYKTWSIDNRLISSKIYITFNS